MNTKPQLWLIMTVAATLMLGVFGFADDQASTTGTGRIEGTLTDKATGDPIVGASVTVIGTPIGAVTDFNGKFVIAQLRGGTYSLRLSHLEYGTVEVLDVIVKSDRTTELAQTMERKVTDIGKTIKVEAEHDVINKFETSNQNIISKEVIQQQPVQSVDELLSSVAGVVRDSDGEVSVRGGRAGATSIMKRQRATIYCPPPHTEPSGRRFPPAHGGSAIVNGEPFDAMFFQHHGVNPFVDTEDDHLSTFAIDVDDASYVMARSYLERGVLPPADAVRTEEFVNRFSYDYASPHSDAFAVYFEGSPSPYGANGTQLLRIGIKGRAVSDRNRKPAKLVFVVDVSGSMAREDRLGLVKKALRLLVDELRPDDEVGIVVYGSRGYVQLRPTSIRNKGEILTAISMLHPNGATNAEEGLRLGYEMADRNFTEGCINRIILCSDGVANVGVTGPDEILKQIKKYAQMGITLTTVGFGMGNFNDQLMEKLGNKGNGSYAYVDDLQEARRVFVENLTGMLQVIARDVKIQVDFDPNVVRSYRLLGYENRNVADNKFRDDKEDGGEIGSGHDVTALYEIKLHRNAESDQLGRLFVRYKEPRNNRIEEISFSITMGTFRSSFAQGTSSFRLATVAAEFAEIMRESYWAHDGDLATLLGDANAIYNDTNSGEVLELMNLISKAKRLKEQLAEK